MGEKKRVFSVKSQGDSMFPLLQDGDIIEYVPTSFSKVKENDIVLTHVGEIFMTHRVIYKTARYCVTRGDNNPTADSPLQKKHIFARAARFQRKGKWYGIEDIYLRQSALYLHEIGKLEEQFRAQSVSHVFLKGVLVSLRYENSIPKRIYADCDLLVKRNEAQKIEEIFKTLGYEYVGRKISFVSEKKRHDYPEISFMKNVGMIPVVFDVHFEPVFLMTQLAGMNFLYDKQLLEDFGSEMLRNRKRVTVKGTSFTLCSVSDQILYLALHIFHHNFTGSARYFLLNCVITKSASPLVWKNVKETILKYRLQGYVYLVFVLLKKHYKTPVPSRLLRSIAPSWGKRKILLSLVNKIDIFSQDARLNAGVERFILIFILSPEPVWKKMYVFFHPDTLQSTFFILKKKIVKSFKVNNKILIQ